MAENAYIEIKYKNDGRVVEGPCSGLMKFVLCGLAKPKTSADEKKLRAWADDLDEDDRASVHVAAVRVLPERYWGREHDRGHEDSEATEPDEPTDVDQQDDGDDDEKGDDARDGWPVGVTVDRKGSYFALTGSDGNPIESDKKSGKFNGEDAAQAAAWDYEAALKRG